MSRSAPAPARCISSSFALLAILPVALTVSPPAATTSLRIALCNGDGVIRSLVIPLPQKAPTRGNDDPCCAKACHSGGSRKKVVREEA